MEVGIAEEYPAEADEMESDEDAEHATPAVALLAFLTAGDGHPHLVQRQRHAVKHSPQDEVPRSSVPQSAQEHGDNKVQVLAEFPLPVSSQRDV